MTEIYTINEDLSQKVSSGRIYVAPKVIMDDAAFVKLDDAFVTKIQGSNLDVDSRVFTGDINKVKNVHFIKGTCFCRDYFKRMYPNINIRHKASLSDLIVYDNKALFNNDIPTQLAYRVNDELVLTYRLIQFLFKIKTIYNSTAGAISIKFSDKFNKIFTDNIINKKSVFEFAEKVYIGSQKNEYFAELINSNSPFLHVDKILSEMDTSLRSHNMTESELHSLIAQAFSKDKDAAKSALESIIMYDHKKYSIVQAAMIVLTGSMDISKKIQLFCNSFNVSKYSSINDVMAFLSYINWGIQHLSNESTDYNILRSFVRNEDIHNYLTNKNMTISDVYGLRKMGYYFEFKDDRLNYEIEDSNQQQESANSLEDFLV